MPAKRAEIEPWQIVQVDLVGPWTVSTPSGKKQLLAFTAIDPATGWFEVVDIPDKSAGTVMVHTNGTVKIQCGIIQETVNLRRLEPFFE